MQGRVQGRVGVMVLTVTADPRYQNILLLWLILKKQAAHSKTLLLRMVLFSAAISRQEYIQ